MAASERLGAGGPDHADVDSVLGDSIKHAPAAGYKVTVSAERAGTAKGIHFGEILNELEGFNDRRLVTERQLIEYIFCRVEKLDFEH